MKSQTEITNAIEDFVAKEFGTTAHVELTPTLRGVFGKKDVVIQQSVKIEFVVGFP